MPGYHINPQAQADTLLPGGRLRTLIAMSGFHGAPAEREAALLARPAMPDAAWWASLTRKRTRFR